MIIKYNYKINSNNDIEFIFYYSYDKFSVLLDLLYKYSNRLVILKWNYIFNEKNKGLLILINSEYKFNIDYEFSGINLFDFGYRINEI